MEAGAASLAESTQHVLSRVRPPRVQITYDVEIGGAIEKKELPFIVGIMADLSGQAGRVCPRSRTASSSRSIATIQRGPGGGKPAARVPGANKLGPTRRAAQRRAQFQSRWTSAQCRREAGPSRCADSTRPASGCATCSRSSTATTNSTRCSRGGREHRGSEKAARTAAAPMQGPPATRRSLAEQPKKK